MLLFTLIKREFTEHKSLWLAPLIGMLIIAFIQPWIITNNNHISITLNNETIAMSALSPDLMKHIGLDNMPWFYYTVMFIITKITVTIYALNALFLDRQDRTVLFWKSIKISDAQIVLSKFFTASITLLTVWAYSLLLTLFWKTSLIITNLFNPHPVFVMLSTHMLNLSDFYPIILHNALITILYPFSILFALFCSSYAKRSPFWCGIFALIITQLMIKFALNMNMPGLTENIANISLLVKPATALNNLMHEFQKTSTWILYIISMGILWLSILNRKWRHHL